MDAAAMTHGISDEQLPGELSERQRLLNEATHAILHGHAEVAKQALDEQEVYATRARARLRERERFTS